jgi:hypothetical protein
MKKLSKIVWLVVVMNLFGFAGQSFANSACVLTLAWQPSPDSGVAGYALYYGAAGAPLTNRVDVGMQTTTELKSLTASVEYAFYVVAYDASQNESAPSDPLFYTVEAISELKLGQSANGSMNLSFRVAPNAPCRVEYTDSLTPPNWNLLTMATGDSNGAVSVNDAGGRPMRFYRGVAQEGGFIGGGIAH